MLKESGLVIFLIMGLVVMNAFARDEPGKKMHCGLGIEKIFESMSLCIASTADFETNFSLEDETQEKTEHNQGWQSPDPSDDDFDWIELVSGEWLKGELKVLLGDKLEFDSDKLDLQHIDWEDVKQVRSPHVFSVRFEGSITVAGILQVIENKVVVIIDGESREFDRSQLISIVAGEPKEINYWSAKLSLGLNFTKGNTNQTQYNAIANIGRLSPASRFVLEYFSNINRTEDESTVNNQRINSYFDVFKTRKYFFRPIFGEYYRDPFKNLEYRLSLGAGIGYQLIDTSKTNLDIAIGLAYQNTQFVSVRSGENSNKSTPALTAGSKFDTELSRTIDFYIKFNFQFVDRASGRYTHHAMTSLETELTGWLDFDISLIWDRTQIPTPKADGTMPKKDDFQIVFSLGFDF